MEDNGDIAMWIVAWVKPYGYVLWWLNLGKKADRNA
jgi:hypothetical protein